jgi:uncharacterized protein YfkK (UPF0435 family)
MLSESTVRQISELRVLLRRGVFSRLKVSLPNGGMLPAETFAEVVFNDLDYLTNHVRTGDEVSAAEWQRLVRDLQRLHEVAIPQFCT